MFVYFPRSGNKKFRREKGVGGLGEGERGKPFSKGALFPLPPAAGGTPYFKIITELRALAATSWETLNPLANQGFSDSESRMSEKS